MALTEKRTLASVNILPNQAAAEVLWYDQIVDDSGAVKGQQNFRCAYTVDQKAQFITDLENPANGGSTGMATPYITALSW